MKVFSLVLMSPELTKCISQSSREVDGFAREHHTHTYTPRKTDTLDNFIESVSSMAVAVQERMGLLSSGNSSHRVRTLDIEVPIARFSLQKHGLIFHNRIYDETIKRVSSKKIISDTQPWSQSAKVANYDTIREKTWVE